MPVESGWSLEKMDTVDNITLNTIILDYESYFQNKYNKRPKITKILNFDKKFEIKKNDIKKNRKVN